MAFNGMKVIHSGLGDRLRYIMNPDKTEDSLLCTGINTLPDMAYQDMMDTKRRFGKLDKRQGYHIIQSFAPGEIEPDAALRFGMEFIEKYLDNRYEGVAAVHTDKAHIHVHMIFNSVSFIDGRKYHAAKGEYLERIRELCDEQCREWGLSVIEGNFKKVKTTKDEARRKAQGKPTCRDMIRADIDRALRECIRWTDFVIAMRQLGYDVKETPKNVSLRGPGMKRFVRLSSLGEGYDKRSLEVRISNNLWRNDAIRPIEVRFPPDDALGKFIGTQADYYNVTQQMRRLMDRQHLRYAPALRAEIRKLEQYDEDLRFQEKYNITSKEQLQEHKVDLQFIIDEIVRRREPIYKERRTAAAKANPQRMAELEEELKKYKATLASLRHELRVATRIEDRLENKLPEMLAAREAQERIKQEMKMDTLAMEKDSRVEYMR